MQLTVNKTVQETIEVSFPLYTKTCLSIYCFPNESKCIQILNGCGENSIRIHNVFPDSWMLETPATFDEFEKAYSDAAMLLIEEINALTSMPAPEVKPTSTEAK